MLIVFYLCIVDFDTKQFKRYIMKDLSFIELIAIARSLFVDYSRLVSCDEQDDVSVSALENSDVEYDKLSALIKVLSELYKYRTLPF